MLKVRFGELFYPLVDPLAKEEIKAAEQAAMETEKQKCIAMRKGGMFSGVMAALPMK